MKNKKILLFVFLLSILLLQNISAVTTNFNVSTLREHTLKVEFFQQTNGIPELYESNDLYTPNGKLSFDFSNSANEFTLNVFLMKGDDVKYHHKFEEVEAGNNYILIFNNLEQSLEEVNLSKKNNTESKGDEVVVTTNLNSSNSTSNSSEVNVTNETSEIEDIMSEVEDRAGLISGNAIFNGGIINSWFFYALVLIILAMGIMFAFFKSRNKEQKENFEDKQKNSQENSQEIKVRKLSDLKKEKQEYVKTKQERINEIEEKIKQLQGELEDIKKGNKVEELKDKIRKDQEELEKAKQEEFGNK